VRVIRPVQCQSWADLRSLSSAQIIEDLASTGRFNGTNFCIVCMVCAFVV
jgi:ribosomal protein S26